MTDIAIGANDLDDLRLGSAQVDAVYRGTNLVWSAGSSLVFVGSGRDANSGTFTATMPINQTIPAGHFVLIAVQVRNVTVNNIVNIQADGSATSVLQAYVEAANCGTPAGSPWEHGWASSYIASWGGGVLGNITASVTNTTGVNALVFAFSPQGLSHSSDFGSIVRNQTSLTATAQNNANKVVEILIGNSTDSSLSAGQAFSETGTPSPETVQTLLDGPDADTAGYPIMMIDRLLEQPAGGVPYQLDIPGSNTGFGQYSMSVVLV